MIWRLPPNIPDLFPDPYDGEPDGLIAIGGDLSPERLFYAYCRGIFPWYDFKENDEIMWWCPLDRFVIFPAEIHISHSMRQLIKKGTYNVTFNEAFEQVIEHCGKTDKRNEQTGAWLGNDMMNAYKKMFTLGLASSVEVWQPDASTLYGRKLVGGLYGINIGNNFFGESMFSLIPSASKLALIHLAERLEPHGGIIDCQFETPHLKTMGGRHISYEEYMTYLAPPTRSDNRLK